MISAQIDFDPYAAWLNVQSQQRPLNPYELLGLEPLDENPIRLRAALTRKREMLAAKRLEADPEIWRRVNDELEAAIATLQISDLRAVLDATLRRRGLAAASDSPPIPSAAVSAGNGPIVCRHCQRENPPQRRFCGGCGESLWEKCSACGTEMSSDERFCGTCGSNVRGKRQEAEQGLREKLEQARQLAGGHRYQQALSLLRSVAATEDRQYSNLADAALAEIIRVEASEKRQQQLAQIALQQGEELLARRSFEGAVQVLESIPEPLRNSEITDTLARAQSQWKELLALSGEIRTLVQEKRTGELLPKIERLLMLKPDHAQAQKLAEQLRDQLVATAKKRVSDHQYSDALRLLEQIPSFARNEQVETLAEQALELSTLLMELKLAPLALPSVLAVVQKLLKFAPGNQDAARLVEQLKARVPAKPDNPRLAAPGWAKPPKQTRVQVPVDWLGHFTRLGCADEKGAKTLREHPGEFFVALGLALQGIEEAQIAMNLLPREKTGMLGKLPFSFGRKGPPAAWGLDLGEHALRAIKLSKDPKSGVITFEACEYLRHEQPLIRADSSARREELAAQTLKEFLSRTETTGSKVIAALPGDRVLGRFFDLPPMPAKKVPETVQYEARHQIPISFDELGWAYEILDEEHRGSKPAEDVPRKILLVACRLNQVQEQVAFFKVAGITLDELTTTSVALHNAVRFDLQGDESSQTLALLDVGMECSNLVVSSPHAVWFRSFGPGGENFTQALSRQLQLTREQGEELKRNPAKARRFSLYCAAQEPLLVQLVGETERSLASYSRYNSSEPVMRLYGLGGGFQAPGLLRYLRWGK